MTPPSVIPGITDGRLTDLYALAAYLTAQLTANRRPDVDDELALDAAMWKVTEEVGELAGAHSRCRGTSRRSAPDSKMPSGEMISEAADVLLSVAVYAVQADLGSGCLALSYELHRLARAAGLLAGGHYETLHCGLQAGLLPHAVAEVIDRLCDYAIQAGINLRTAVAAKAQQNVTRGWREEDAHHA